MGATRTLGYKHRLFAIREVDREIKKKKKSHHAEKREEYQPGEGSKHFKMESVSLEFETLGY